MSEITTKINLEVNGKPVKCLPKTKLPDLLTELDLNPRLIAIEYNGEIIHKEYWNETILQEGDRLEIVTIVGGGDI